LQRASQLSITCVLHLKLKESFCILTSLAIAQPKVLAELPIILLFAVEYAILRSLKFLLYCRGGFFCGMELRG